MNTGTTWAAKSKSNAFPDNRIFNFNEGHSINKLQNGVILLIFRLWKFRNIHFVGDLIMTTSYEFCHDDITVTSFINIRYGNVAVEIILQGTALCYSFAVAKGLSANAIQSQMHPGYNDTYLQDQQYMFGVKSLLMVEKVLLMRKNLVAVMLRRPMQRSQQSIPSCGQTGVWRDMNLDDTLKNETLMFDV